MHARVVVLCLLIICAEGRTGSAQKLLTPETFQEFLYPGAKPEPAAIKALDQKILTTFPDARPVKLTSLLTPTAWQKVVAYYTIMTGLPFRQIGPRFYFIFSSRNGIPTDYIEVCPIQILRGSSDFWPARINLVLLSFPLAGLTPASQPTTSELKPLTGRLWYPGQTRNDLAALKNHELGAGAQVLIILTEDSFDKVYSFFRRNYGRIYIVNAHREHFSERDFEFDASSALSTRRHGKELHIRVEENPLLVDREGNSERLLGKCLVQYTFWPAQ